MCACSLPTVCAPAIAGEQLGKAVQAVWAAVASNLVADGGARIAEAHLPDLMPPLAAVLNRPTGNETAERVRFACTSLSGQLCRFNPMSCKNLTPRGERVPKALCHSYQVLP